MMYISRLASAVWSAGMYSGSFADSRYGMSRLCLYDIWLLIDCSTLEDGWMESDRLCHLPCIKLKNASCSSESWHPSNHKKIKKFKKAFIHTYGLKCFINNNTRHNPLIKLCTLEIVHNLINGLCTINYFIAFKTFPLSLALFKEHSSFHLSFLPKICFSSCCVFEGHCAERWICTLTDLTWLKVESVSLKVSVLIGHLS